MDSNEYLFAFGFEPLDESVELLTLLGRRHGAFNIHLPRLVVDEVTRNLPAPLMKECHRFWKTCGAVIDEEEIIPLGTIKSFRERGLKSGDATIAAYCAHLKIRILVSENRDFLALTKSLPFRVLKSAEFLKVISRST